MLSSTQWETFEADGFLVVREFFSPDEARALRVAVDGAVQKRSAGRTFQPVAERDGYEQMFTQYFNLWEDSPEVRVWSCHPRLGEAASDLLRAPTVRLFCDQSFYKDAGGAETSLHQDYPLMSIAEPRTLNVWIPLERTGPENGSLGYVRGSHRMGPLQIRMTPAGPYVDAMPVDDPAFAAMERQVLELDAGDVVFHHVLTYHFAPPNRSSTTRKALAVTYFADGCTRGSAFPHASLNRQGIGLGQRIEGPATPIVWPAPAQPPEPPVPLRRPPYGWPGLEPFAY